MSLLKPTPSQHLLRRRAILAVAILLIGVVYPAFYAQKAEAATMTRAFVRFDRMLVSTATTGTVCAQTASAGVETSVVVTFPTGYTLGTAANFTVSTTNLAWPTGGTAWPGIGTASNVTGQVVTFPSTDLSTATLYCFNWTNTAAVSIKSSAGTDLGGTINTNIDTATSFATAALAVSPGDQITVTASVPQTFSFAISANTDALGTLATGSNTASPTPRTATLNTNAKNGWYVWAKDANTGLNSATASYTIASTTPGSNSTLVAGTEGYNMGVTSTQAGGTGTITVAAPFVGGSTGKGGGLDTSLRTVASSGGTASNAVLTLTNNADITGTTPAATDYTDIITLTAAGLF